MKIRFFHLITFALTTLFLTLGNVSVYSQPAIDQTGTFDTPITTNVTLYSSIIFSDTNANNEIDAVFALSQGALTDWSDYSVALRFNTSVPYVDVRDGGGFVYDNSNPVNIEFDTKYRCWIVVDFDSFTYDTYVKTDATADPVLIYAGASFRNQPVSELDVWSAIHNSQGDPDGLSVQTVDFVNDVGEYPDNYSNASLTDISITSGTLEPAFDPEVTEYFVSLAEGTTSVLVSATTDYIAATLEGEGVVNVSQTGSGSSEIIVTADDELTQKSYTITFEVEGNYALSLPGGNDGANSNVTLPPLNISGLPITIEMWYKPDHFQNDYATLIYSREPGGAPDMGIQYDRWDDQSKIKGVWRGTSELPEVTPVPGQWNHIAMVVSSTSKTLYINGEASTQTGSFENFPFNEATYLGWDNVYWTDPPQTGRTLTGLIDEVRIWTSERTAQELHDNKYEKLNGNETGLHGYWNFDDGASTATDATSNNLNGTINGGTYAVSNIFDPMAYISSDIAQGGGFVNTNSSNNVVMKLTIETKNQNNPLRLTSLNLSATGTTNLSDVLNVKVYATGLETAFSTRNMIGETSETPGAMDFAITTDYELAGGINHIWITYDIDKDAENGNILDLACNEFVLTGDEASSYTPAKTTTESNLVINSELFINNQKLPVNIVTSEAASSIEGANFASFQQNAIMTYNGYQYVTYWNTASRVCIARRKIQETTWEILELDAHTVTEGHVADNHYSISMGICENDGTIHLAYDHHNNPLNYQKSVKGLANDPENFPWTNASFGPRRNYLESGETLNNVTYPRFVSKPDGDLIFECRIGWSGSGDSFLWEYSAESGAWDYIGEYLHGTSVDENAYINGVHYDPNGRMHVSWVWRETPDPRTNHDVYYAYSDDDGRTWYNTHGNHIGTVNSNPMGLNTQGLKVWSVGTYRGLINQESQAVDSKGGIHILQSYMPEEQPDNSDFWGSRINHGYLRHIYQDESGTWQSDLIAPSTRNRSEIAVDANDNLYVVAPDYRVYFASAASNWAEWTEFDGSKTGISINEGLIDRQALLNEHVLSFVFSHSDNDGKIIVPHYLLENLTPGTGEGLNMSIFDEKGHQNPVEQKLEQVNTSGEDIVVDTETAYISWSGIIETQYAEAYTLYLTTSGNTKMRINGELVVETGDINSTTEFETSLDVIPTHKYDIRIEGTYNTQDVTARLEWASESQERETVPLTSLYGTIIDYSTSVRKVSDIKDWHIFPMPFSTTFTIQAGGVFDYEIFNLNGTMVEKGNGENNCEAGNLLEKGIYLLKVAQGDNQRTVKIIKQ